MSSKVVPEYPGKREQKKLINPENYTPPQCYKERNKNLFAKKEDKKLKIPPK